MPTVIIPPAPGHFSAHGMLVADLRRDFVRTWFRPVAKVDFDEVERIYRSMEDEGTTALVRDVEDPSRIAVARGADMRYVGQEHSVTVDLPLALFEKQDRDGIKRHFDEVHGQRYGFNAPKEPAEIVSLHSSVVGKLDKPVPRRMTRDDSPDSAAKALTARRKVYFTETGAFVDTPVYTRDALRAGAKLAGPALVEEYASTTVVFPGDTLEVSEYGDLIITIARS